MGTAYFPAEISGGRPEEVLDPAGFSVHMTRADDPGEETVHAAGQPFVPRSGRWRVWLQGEWSMTPFSSLVVFPSPDRWNRLRPKMLPVRPAGRVVAPEGDLDTQGADLWILFADGTASGHQGYEMSRRRSFTELGAGPGLLMPAGRNLAGSWNRREERFTALSRPFQVEPGRVRPAPLETPDESESWLVAYMERAGDAPERDLADIEVAAVQQGESFPPDETVKTRWGLYAIWYGLTPGPARLTGGGESVFIEPQSLQLEPGRIHRHDGNLVPRPSLTVSLVLPAEVREEPFRLEVYEVSQQEPLAVQEMGRRDGSHRFTRLVSGTLRVRLVTSLGSFSRRIELAPGEDRSLALEPDLIEIYGQVHHGGEPSPAELRFQTVQGDVVTAGSDDEGVYRAVSLQPLRWVDVDVEGAEHPPWRDFFSPSLSIDQELDFDIPDSQILVQVMDARTGEGLENAKVAVRNLFLVPYDFGEDGGSTTTDRVLVQHHRTDSEGRAVIPPPRPGELKLLAFADGYAPMDEPVRLEVGETSVPEELELRLEPYGDLVPVRLLLPDGSPAREAEVLLVESLPGGEIVFTGRADPSGVVSIPSRAAGGMVLVKHPGAASQIFPWTPPAVPGDGLTWSLPAAASAPFSVRVLDPSGLEPAAGAQIHLWLGGHLLSGRDLRWLLDAPMRSGSDGFWRARKLPLVPLRLLALESGSPTGPMEGLGHQVTVPWPTVVEVRVVR